MSDVVDSRREVMDTGGKHTRKCCARFYVHLSRYTEKHNHQIARTSIRLDLDIRLQQCLLEASVLILHLLDIVLIEIVIPLIEVFYPAVQLLENVVQSLDETFSVVSRSNSAKVLPNDGAHLAKPVGPESVPL